MLEMMSLHKGPREGQPPASSSSGGFSGGFSDGFSGGQGGSGAQGSGGHDPLLSSLGLLGSMPQQQPGDAYISNLVHAQECGLAPTLTLILTLTLTPTLTLALALALALALPLTLTLTLTLSLGAGDRHLRRFLGRDPVARQSRGRDGSRLKPPETAETA